jgi:hypothetical protein
MASKRGLRRRACQNKQAYRTLQAAETAMERVFTRMGYDAALNAFRCPVGGNHFHIGHSATVRNERERRN